ncbi:unconventional myosin-XVIIIa isoform X5 [Agrilus planipennis]|uniref:Unconventional myosin-XVIIIa isoform X5 n=1 Tax=Agrilus planipennis TaxID=224129 RepID=A0A1W4WCB3_AGRPL|nr:unconventional myosin-XVIIIa isoform X5 [Agrilus planipennis]
MPRDNFGHLPSPSPSLSSSSSSYCPNAYSNSFLFAPSCLTMPLTSSLPPHIPSSSLPRRGYNTPVRRSTAASTGPKGGVYFQTYPLKDLTVLTPPQRHSSTSPSKNYSSYFSQKDEETDSKNMARGATPASACSPEKEFIGCYTRENSIPRYVRNKSTSPSFPTSLKNDSNGSSLPVLNRENSIPRSIHSKSPSPFTVSENSFKNLPPRPTLLLNGYGTPSNDNYVSKKSFAKSPSPSPCSSVVSCSRPSSMCTNSHGSVTPRRVFPQVGVSVDLDDLESHEESPVIFDANLTFVLGCKAKIKQHVTPIPAFMDKGTTSNYLTNKISDFLNRTDHVMEEWKRLGKKEPSGDDSVVLKNAKQFGRSKSATNILIKGFQLYSRTNSCRSSLARDVSEDRTEAEIDELSEMTADLAEEHSTSTLATERLEAETSERMRLERELTEVQNKNKVLQDSSERLELELLYAKSDLNGISEEDDDGCADNNDANIYKQRYERAKKELEFTKKRLQQQHEDDLEQLVGLKKQLEKKLTDAYEEVEEQKQVVGQWKRKVQKLNSETNDLRLLLEEQSARNNLLEKKQRKFDSEMQLLQDELRSERQARDRLSREKDVILTEKYNVETNLADTKLELELKEEKLRALQKELDELTHGGKTEEEIAVLRKQKMDMERRLLDQEEELDELAGQVQLLEQSKVRLEMSLEQQRKEAKKEAQQRDDEIEEIRCNAQKKVKALEAQLENEHEERTQLLRDKHELERRLTAFAESDRNDRAGDEALLQRLKRDLKRSKVLLRDTQAQLDRQKSENPSKAVIRQLRNQIEDLDYARSSAVKAKQSVETELFELQTTLEETQKGRHDAEEKVNSLSREKSDLQAQLEENEEELAEVLKKYKAAVQQMSLDQLALQEQVSLVSELEAERNTLKEQLAEVTSKLESAENIGEASSNLLVKRLELKNKELESKLDLEQTTRSRLETQITRLKEAVDKLQNEIVSHRTKEQLAQENVRKLQKNIRELKEELGHHQSKENEWLQKKKELEKRCECLEVEASASKADLKLALKRIEDLQAAIQGDLEEGTTESDSEQVSYSSEESLNSFPSKLSLKPTGFDGERRLVWNQLSGTSKSSSMSNSQGKDGSFA